jgi:hypothetical protein
VWQHNALVPVTHAAPNVAGATITPVQKPGHVCSLVISCSPEPHEPLQNGPVPSHRQDCAAASTALKTNIAETIARNKKGLFPAFGFE